MRVRCVYMCMHIYIYIYNIYIYWMEFDIKMCITPCVLQAAKFTKAWRQLGQAVAFKAGPG